MTLFEMAAVWWQCETKTYRTIGVALLVQVKDKMAIYSVKRIVRLQDIDAAGIVFFPKFLEYCHDAYFELLMNNGIDLPNSISTGKYILPLVHTEADFKWPLRFGDKIVVHVENVVKGTSSYRVNYLIVLDDDSQTVCCTAQTVHAAISRTTFKPLKEVPAEIVSVLQMESAESQ